VIQEATGRSVALKDALAERLLQAKAAIIGVKRAAGDLAPDAVVIHHPAAHYFSV
jgi:hypothetical protein